MKQTAPTKRMGRPPAANPKAQLVHLRLTESLLAEIDAEIDPHVGQDRSQVIRVLLVEALRARKLIRVLDAGRADDNKVKGRRTE